MSRMTLVVLVVVLGLGMLCVGALAGVFAGAAKLFFFITTALFQVLVVAGVIGGGGKSAGEKRA